MATQKLLPLMQMAGAGLLDRVAPVAVAPEDSRQSMMRNPYETRGLPPELGIQQNPYDTGRGFVDPFTPMKAGGGQFVTEDQATVWDGQGFSPKPEEPWYKRAMNDPALMARLAMGFNTMRLNPDQGLAAMLGERIKTASEIGRQNKTAEKVAVALQNQGRFQEAALVEANPEIAKDMLAALMKPTKSFLTMSGAQANKMLNSNVFKPDQAVKLDQSTMEFSGIGSAGTNIDIKLDQGGKDQLKRAGDITDRAMASPELMINAQNMLDLLDSGVQTGFGQEAMLNLRRVVQQINPNIDVGDVAGQEAFLAASTKAILPLVKQLGVNPTDTDLRFIETGSATLGKSVAGNKLMLKAILFKAQRDQMLGEWANQWSIDNADLIKSQGVVANAKFNQALLGLMKTHPMFTQATKQLRDEYNAVLGANPQRSGTRGALEQGGFITSSPATPN